MSVSSPALVELVLRGATNDRRQLQDSPVLADVLIAYALRPAEAVDLLITPDQKHPAGPVAALISLEINKLGVRHLKGQEPEIAYLHGLIAARLLFEELFLVVVPMTFWWSELRHSLMADRSDARLKRLIRILMEWAKAKNEDVRIKAAENFSVSRSLERFICLAGVILWAAKNKTKTSLSAADALAKLTKPDPVVTLLKKVLTPILKDHTSTSDWIEPKVWQIALNRRVMVALDRSVPAVKGDAARTLFNVKCDRIRWAVVDSGIDGNHSAFKGMHGENRILKAFDFSNIRQIVSVDNLNTSTARFKERVKALIKGRLERLTERQATAALRELAKDAENDRPIHWELVEQFLSIDPRTPPNSGHGTHVAGIIGANRGTAASGFCDGMCPDINLYDFRVLAKSMQDTEFAIIAALQFIRYLNDRYTYLSIHGVNISLSIPHDVRNYACGRTPVCLECERLVENGVVVVAPAGNFGYHTFVTSQGSYEGYAALSITDPGNAEDVITVGATHRDRPHTYGVSFFSSRGPTGDGRLKPDLVAPGERIGSCFPEESWGQLDGTSMAAPHVSGAAAMLMGRYQELIGEPRKIKSILCSTATNLGRERSFQGHGMLDVLRALQSM
jgi:serine protease AprX